jgi:hypothetical protein
LAWWVLSPLQAVQLKLLPHQTSLLPCLRKTAGSNSYSKVTRQGMQAGVQPMDRPISLIRREDRAIRCKKGRNDPRMNFIVCKKSSVV